MRSLSHGLKPLIHIGKEGVNETTISATADALNTRELMKVRVLDAAPESARQVGLVLAEQIEGAELVHVIGRVVVLYRPFPKGPEIRLPV